MDHKEQGFFEMVVGAMQRYADTGEAAYLEMANTGLTWLRQYRAQRQPITTIADMQVDPSLVRTLPAEPAPTHAPVSDGATAGPKVTATRQAVPTLRQTRPIGHHAVIEPGLVDPKDLRAAKDLRNALNALRDGDSVYLTAAQAEMFDRGAVHWTPTSLMHRANGRGRARTAAED